MTNLERKHFAEMAQKAAALQKIWLREREEQRQAQATANAVIKRRWVESDSAPAIAMAANQLGGDAELTDQGQFSGQVKKERR